MFGWFEAETKLLLWFKGGEMMRRNDACWKKRERKRRDFHEQARHGTRKQKRCDVAWRGLRLFFLILISVLLERVKS